MFWHQFQFLLFVGKVIGYHIDFFSSFKKRALVHYEHAFRFKLCQNFGASEAPLCKQLSVCPSVFMGMYVQGTCNQNNNQF